MKTYRWFSFLSRRQMFWLYGTIIFMIAVTAVGILTDSGGKKKQHIKFTIDMSIKEIAPGLKVTGKALARELGLPMDTPKKKPLSALDVKSETLDHAVHHLLSHKDSLLKYYVYLALAIGGLVFLSVLGRPDLAKDNQRREWYPRTPYIIFLAVSVIVAGFLLGKSPNPMEGAVKVLKSMVGLYPDPAVKTAAFLFFICLSIIGNKLVCGWACPFGALQELIYSIPIMKKLKQKKLPFALTNTIRIVLFITMVIILFGFAGGRRGMVIYHYINPFNLFNMEFETTTILLTVILSLMVAFVVYRPFCQLICPFGLISWIAERFSIIRIKIDKNKCTQCGACIAKCPLDAAKGRVQDVILPQDCFSCARCLNACPFDAIQYGPFFYSPVSQPEPPKDSPKE